MLNIFRQRQSLVRGVLWVVLILVCVGMVVTLIPGFGDVSDTANNPIVVEVGHDRITEADVQESVQQVSASNRIPAGMIPFYTGQIVNSMVMEKASLQEAERLGLKVDEAEMVAQLRRDPNLFPNGVFIGQQQYEDLVQERFGMSVAKFEQRYRDAILIDKLRALVTDSVSVTPDEIHKAFISDNEKIVLDYVDINPADLKKEINPTDSVLEEYYKTNKARYQMPEKRQAKILVIDKDKTRQSLSVSDDDIKKYYQAHLDTYRVPERVMASHILLKADAKVPGKIEEAKKKAEDIEKKLKGGADFATLAKQYSEDTTTAQNGGSLNWITRKQTVPEFEKVAFSLAPGTISDPVQTVYGIHIIKVMQHEQAHQQSLDEVKSTIQTSLLDEKVAKAMADAADAAAAALAKTPDDINSIAEKYHATVLTPAPFVQNESLPTIGANQAFMQEVFALQKGHAGTPVPLATGYAIPVLQEIIAPHQGEFAESKEQVKNDYIGEQTKAKALVKAKDLAAALDKQQDKKDLGKAAKALGLTVQTSQPLTRDGSIPSLGIVKDLDPKIFDLPVGAIGGPKAVQTSQVIYQVKSHELPKEEEFAGKREQIQDKLLNEKRQLAFDIFQDSLKKQLTVTGHIKVHQDALARLTSAPPTGQ